MDANADALDASIELSRKLICAWDRSKAFNRPPRLQRDVDAHAEELISFLLDNYSGAIRSMDLNQVFGEQVDDRLSKDYLQNIPRALVPVTIMREIMKKHRVLFTPSNVPKWREFSMRYGRYIMTV